MTRFLGLAFLAVLGLLVAWGGALALLGTSPRWLAGSPHGERAYGALVVVAAAGLRAWPALLGAAAVLGGAWLWRRRAA